MPYRIAATICAGLFLCFVASVARSDTNIDINQHWIEMNVDHTAINQTSIFVVPPEVSDSKEVVLRQTVTLRGSFDKWFGDFGNHRLEISRYGSEFRGFVTLNVERRDAERTKFFSFTTNMMANGLVRYGKRYRFEQRPYEILVQPAELEAYGFEFQSLAFRVLILKDREQSDAPIQFETEPFIWQGSMQYISTSIGNFHLNVENDGTTVYVEYCPGPDYRHNKIIARLSQDELVEAIQTGREIEFSKRGFTIIFVFTEVEFDPEDGQIDTLEGQVHRSSN